VSEILDIDVDFRNKVSNSLAKLQPYKIGKKGNLQEWYHDWEDNDPQHRHQTHLYGLYPGQQISPAKTPELAEACRNVLEVKGDETTGWSKGWRINLWARLWDGNRAYKMYRELLNLVEPSAEKKGFKGGTYPNLFDAHPPFQIDGNFGGSAAVIEMLVQSNNNIIRLLPALPDAWIEGKIEGICARGGFEIAMKWENKKVLELTIVSKTDTEATLIHLGKEKQLNLKKGKPVTLKW
jgi:alpha-L-fucosidase 2